MTSSAHSGTSGGESIYLTGVLTAQTSVKHFNRSPGKENCNGEGCPESHNGETRRWKSGTEA